MDDVPAPGPLNTAADNAVAQSTAEAGIVMLKNAGVLPLKGTIRRIAVIGGHADRGVLSGGGSSQVVPLGSWRPTPSGESPSAFRLPYYHPSAPVASLRARVPDAQVTFFAGNDVAAAVAAAKDADVAVVFAEQWTGETRDAEFRLSDDQEQLIRAVAKANRVTVVVLETGGQVLMPWIATVPAVVAAWYPGGRGGEAIARLLFGDFNPTGRLPVTVPASASQLPRGQPGGLGIAIDRVAPSSAANDPSFPVAYIEGSSVGYRWFAERQEKALFPFGFGLSYTRYRYSNPRVVGGDMLKVSVTVKNSGARAGTETAQAYLLKAPGRSQRRLLGWTQVHLEPGETRTVDISVEPRLLSNWDQAAHSWRIDAGRYEIFVGSHAEDSTLRAHADLRGRALKP